MSAETKREQKRSPLFRKEVAEELTNSNGRPLELRPPEFGLIIVILFFFATLLVVFLWHSSYSQRSDVSGILVPSKGLIKVTASGSGRLSSSDLREGQKVVADQLLFLVSDAANGGTERTVSTLLKLRRDSLAAEEASVRAQQSTRAAALDMRITAAREELIQIDEQIKAQEGRVEISERRLTIYADLEQEAFVAPAQILDRKAELLDQKQRLADLRRIQRRSALDIESAKSEARDFDLQRERDANARLRSISEADQAIAENETRLNMLIRAPVSGVVTGITLAQGQSVTGGQVLASIIPEGSTLEAELYVPSKSIGLVEVGRPVLLRYQAFPYEKYGQATGMVREVSQISMRAQELALLRSIDLSEPMYRVRVALTTQTISVHGRLEPLTPGAAVDASIVLDKRRLYEKILEPLYALTARF